MSETTLTGKRQITIPAEVCRALGLKTGDKLVVLVADGEIRMRPIEKTIFRPFRLGSGLFKTAGIATGPGNLSIDHDRYLANTAEAEEK